jgi:hypothetical protein
MYFSKTKKSPIIYRGFFIDYDLIKPLFFNYTASVNRLIIFHYIDKINSFIKCTYKKLAIQWLNMVFINGLVILKAQEINPNNTTYIYYLKI